MSSFRISDLTADRPDLVEQTAALLQRTFRGRSLEWQDVASARHAVIASLKDGDISRIALDDSSNVVGWVGGHSMYAGHVWEIHPLVVAEEHRRLGLGRALIQDLENLVQEKGALTLWAGSDDEHDETSLSGADLYPPTCATRQPGRRYNHYMAWQNRISVNPAVRGGKPCIKGTRITVYDVLEYLAGGMTEEAILNDFPDLTLDDIRAALAFAAARERRLANSVA